MTPPTSGRDACLPLRNRYLCLLPRDITEQRSTGENSISGSAPGSTRRRLSTGNQPSTKTGLSFYYNQQFVDMWDIPETILTERSEERVLEYVLDMLADPLNSAKNRIPLRQPRSRESRRDSLRMGDGSIGIPPRSSARMAPTMDGSGCIAISPSARSARAPASSTLMDNIPGWSTAVATSQGGPWSSSAKAVRS